MASLQRSASGGLGLEELQTPHSIGRLGVRGQKGFWRCPPLGPRRHRMPPPSGARSARLGLLHPSGRPSLLQLAMVLVLRLGGPAGSAITPQLSLLVQPHPWRPVHVAPHAYLRDAVAWVEPARDYPGRVPLGSRTVVLHRAPYRPFFTGRPRVCNSGASCQPALKPGPISLGKPDSADALTLFFMQPTS